MILFLLLLLLLFIHYPAVPFNLQIQPCQAVVTEVQTNHTGQTHIS